MFQHQQSLFNSVKPKKNGCKGTKGIVITATSLAEGQLPF